jgi:uncharacterized protein
MSEWSSDTLALHFEAACSSRREISRFLLGFCWTGWGVFPYAKTMITRRSILSVSFLGMFTVSMLPGQEAGKIAVMLVDGQNNHHWQTTTPVLKEALEQSGKFTVTVVTSPAKEAPASAWETWKPEFSKYKVVVSNYNGADWPLGVKKSFEEYVSGGGGFVCVHAANNAFPSWAEYNKMIGLGGWGGRTEKNGPYVFVAEGKAQQDTTPGPGGHHGAQHEFVVELSEEGKNHAITKGLPVAWKHAKDELYDHLRGPAENMKVLASAYSEETKRNEPMIMTVDYAKGRVFHTAMGHEVYSMKDVGFFATLQRGTEWAATGAVSIPLPAALPTKDAVLPTP